MNKHGFTLIEALISLTLFSVVSLALVTLYIQGSRGYQEESRRTALSTAMTTLSDDLAAEVQAAFGIEPTYGTYTSDATTVILTTPAVDASGNFLSPSGGFVADRIIYTKSGDTIRKVVAPGPGSARAVSDRTVLTKVVGFTFAYNQPTPAASSRLSWDLRLEDRYQERVIKVGVTRAAALRNKS